MIERTVLIIDQNETLLAGLGEMVSAAGHRVVPCRCFEDGKRYLHTHRPHAIVSGVRLGAYNGLHLVVLARALVPDITAIVYSNDPDPGIREDAAMAGATHLQQDALPLHLVSHLNASFASTSPAERTAT